MPRIAIYDPAGNQVDYKERDEIDLRADTLAEVVILLRQPEGLLLSIPFESVYRQPWDCSATGLIEYGEAPFAAAHRALREKYQEDLDLLGKGEKWCVFRQRDERIERHLFFFTGRTHPDLVPVKDAAMYNTTPASVVRSYARNNMCKPTLVEALRMVRTS